MKGWCLLGLVVLLVVLPTPTSAQSKTIRLVNTNGKKTEGRLEVHIGGQWWTVCAESISQAKIGFICKDQKLGSYKGSTLAYGETTDKDIKALNLDCTGVDPSSQTKNSLLDCKRSVLTSGTRCQAGGLMCSAVECVVSDFGAWTDCSAPCGGGNRQRSRTVSVSPTEGLTCPSDLVATETCNAQPCPADCQMGEWTAWANCSAKCGGGIQTRSRAVLKESANGGARCDSELTQTQGCGNDPCGVACQISDWSIWSNCDKDCGEGSKYRLRTVLAPSTFGGKPCGDLNQTYPCNTQSCPVDCLVSDWADWSVCSQRCGPNGTQTRSRWVTNQPQYGGAPCPPLTQTQPCNQQLCAIDCDMTDWTAWSECNKLCGTGAMTRTREVEALPANGGLPCGDVKESDPCNTQRCPEDRASILVDRIRKLELTDRINSLEELQAKQAAELAAEQTQDLLTQIGAAAASSTGGAGGGASFLEMLTDLARRQSDQLPAVGQGHAGHVNAAEVQRAQARLQSFKDSIEAARAELRQLTKKDAERAKKENNDSQKLKQTQSQKKKEDDDMEDVVTDEVDAQGRHHKRHHRRHKHHAHEPAKAAAPQFSQTPEPQAVEPVPPLFAHTVRIPSGNNNDLLETDSTHGRKHVR